MTVQWVRKLGLGSVVTLIAASGFFPGCAENESSLFVYGFKKRENAPACTIDLTATGGVFMAGGILDVKLSSTYYGTPLLGNQLVKRGSSDQLRTETSNIEITQAQVTIEDVSGTGITSYTVPATGIVPVGSGSTPGYGFLSVVMIDPSTGAALAKTLSAAAPGTQKLVVAKLKVFAHTLGGTDLASNEVGFPITVCYDCLTTYSPGTDSTGAKTNCAVSADATTTATAPCLIGQDDVVDCHLL